jgi:hypothetical protein
VQLAGFTNGDRVAGAVPHSANGGCAIIAKCTAIGLVGGRPGSVVIRVKAGTEKIIAAAKIVALVEVVTAWK